jgi:hypothetical protein
MLRFDDYWETDVSKDLITGIKYPKVESNISSSEKVLLSIWRHQYYDPIPTCEFLLCSVNEDKIAYLYKELKRAKIFYMWQESSE